MRDKNDPVVKALLDEMGYHDPVRCCLTCVHYKETDCSGNSNAKSEHCELNPAIHLPVESAGWCLLHVKKHPHGASATLEGVRQAKVVLASNRTPQGETR